MFENVISCVAAVNCEPARAGQCLTSCVLSELEFGRDSQTDGFCPATHLTHLKSICQHVDRDSRWSDVSPIVFTLWATVTGGVQLKEPCSGHGEDEAMNGRHYLCYWDLLLMILCLQTSTITHMQESVATVQQFGRKKGKKCGESDLFCNCGNISGPKSEQFLWSKQLIYSNHSDDRTDRSWKVPRLLCVVLGLWLFSSICLEISSVSI